MVRLLIALALTGLTSIPCLAQADGKNAQSEQPAANTQKQFYRLDFVVQELENSRVVNSRSYSTVMSGMQSSSIRAGAKVPFSTTSGANAQWQQIDVGVSIDCHRLSSIANYIQQRFFRHKSGDQQHHGQSRGK